MQPPPSNIFGQLNVVRRLLQACAIEAACMGRARTLRLALGHTGRARWPCITICRCDDTLPSVVAASSNVL